MGKKYKEEPEEQSGERRRHKRVNKNFILRYYLLDKANEKIEITQLINISIGGICFVTTNSFQPSQKLGIELKTPYLSDTTYLEGTVLQSHEKARNMLYQTRLQFDDLSPQAEFLIARVVEFFENEG